MIVARFLGSFDPKKVPTQVTTPLGSQANPGRAIPMPVLPELRENPNPGSRVCVPSLAEQVKVTHVPPRIPTAVDPLGAQAHPCLGAGPLPASHLACFISEINKAEGARCSLIPHPLSHHCLLLGGWNESWEL